jgi:uncharacterized protein (DUF1015 family)
MAKIFPFRALRYQPSRVSLPAVVTQPYDKITPAMQEGYYAASPYNLVRIILGKSQASDDERNNVYSRAADCFRQWRREGVMVPDPQPSIYLYTQVFAAPGEPGGVRLERRGFIALGKLEDYDNKVVFRHEQTLSKPKADRLNLLRATQAHFGQLFMLYSDPALKINAALRPTGPPDTEVRDDYGVAHSLWKVSDPAVIATVQAEMADKKLIIADGHHRYETALNYRNERRQQSEGGGDAVSDAPFERVMMTFVNMDSPGLVILPTHRVVFGLETFSIFEMIAKLRDYFEVHDLGPVSDLSLTMQRLRHAGEKNTALLAATAHSVFLLRLHPRIASRSLAAVSERQRALDVMQLHKLVLEETLGMSEDDIRSQKHLKYFRDAAEAVDEVRKGADAAFLMNPVRMEQMRDIAFAGEIMPQKSTDFYPKLLSGLTVYSLEEAAQNSASGGQ